MPRPNPPAPRRGPEWNRRYELPRGDSIDGEAQVHYGAELEKCAIIAPTGGVTIGASHLTNCVIVEPCTIGDNVRAVAAILQGVIRDGCHIEAHADVMGHLERNVTLGVGVQVAPFAFVDENANIGDRTVVGEHATVGEDAMIGVDVTIGEYATIGIGTRVPAGSTIRPRTTAIVPSDTAQRGKPHDMVHFHIVDDEEFSGDIPEEAEDGDDESEAGDAIDGDDMSNNDMVTGSPHLDMENFRPGTARSWVLAKLARIANFRSDNGLISKALIKEYRPDLLEHAVVKEILRMTPPPTDEQLNDMSWDALSKAAYDVYSGVKFHAGSTPDWQMLGEKANDVFILAVPDQVWTEVESQTKSSVGDDGWIDEKLLFERSAWHPDSKVRHAVGWVRTLLYPRQSVVVVEIQSDRDWMKFKPTKTADEATTYAAKLLRDMYFESFASDALNIVVEWAFASRYQEVLVLDYKSRVKLGGTPPKSFYDAVPKQYTVSASIPLHGVELYKWVPRDLTVRQIVPNPQER